MQTSAPSQAASSPLSAKTERKSAQLRSTRSKMMTLATGQTGALFSVLLLFIGLLYFVPLRTTVQIGADEGFELAKATLCLKGYHLYSDVWDDHPPLHTFIITQVLRYISSSVAGPRLVTAGFATVLLTCVFLMVLRVSGLLAAAVATALLLASPGFLELSSSCMMEIPALAPAVVALCVLLVARDKKRPLSLLSILFAGVLFGISLEMKLIGLVLLPIAALILWLRQREANARNGGASGSVLHFFRDRGWKKVRTDPARRPLTGLLFDFVTFCATFAVTFVVLDLAIDRGAFLLNFRQSWMSHFAPAVTAAYGSPSDHRFPFALLLKNWDMTIPAVLGIILLLRRARKAPLGIIPVAWLALALTVFATHTPWWSYYYIHIAIPLCWCAGSGIALLLAALSPVSDGVASGSVLSASPARTFFRGRGRKKARTDPRAGFFSFVTDPLS